MSWIETTTADGRTIELRTETVAAIADRPGQTGSELLLISGTTLAVAPGRKEMRDQIEEAERRRTFPQAGFGVGLD